MVTWVDWAARGRYGGCGDGEKLDSRVIKNADIKLYPLANGAESVHGEGARWTLYKQGPDRVVLTLQPLAWGRHEFKSQRGLF